MAAPMTNRVALVTGCGKRDGMGRAIARTLAAAGVAVLVTDKQPAGVLNRRQEVVGADQGDWRGVTSLVEEITWAGEWHPLSLATSPPRTTRSGW
jgi:3-oxoacyl-[acyl-carrier protein] reductase